MLKEQQNFNAGPDGRNTDKVLSSAEENAFRVEERGTLDMYADMVEKGELKTEIVLDKNGKMIGTNIREKNTSDGKPGKILYFDDKNTINAADDYNKKFAPPEYQEPREN